MNTSNLQRAINTYNLLLIIACGMLHARPPGLAWIKTYGTKGMWNEFTSIQQTSDQGFIITGFTDIPNKQKEVWLFKVDSLGDSLWTRTFGGSSYEYGNEVQQTYDGGYIIGGYTGSFGAGYSDVYLIKTDANGDTLWTKTYGGSDFDVGESVIQTKNGGYAIVGYTYSYGFGHINVYLINTDPFGNLIWEKSYGGSMCNYGRAVKQSLDGGYIIAGLTNSYGAGDYDVYVIKTNTNGDTLWTRTYGGPKADQGLDVELTMDGGYIIAGSTTSFGVEKSKIYLIKIDSIGNKMWERTYERSEGCVAQSLRQTNDCGFIITGWVNPSIDAYDVYIMKINGYGDSIWTITFGGVDWDYCRSIIQTVDGGYIAVGMTGSFGPKGVNAFIIKTQSDIDTLGALIPERSVFSSPNPFKSKIALHYMLPYVSTVQITISNILGAKTITLLDDVELAGMHVVYWDGNDSHGDNLPAGIYFCCMETSVFSTIEKIIKLK